MTKVSTPIKITMFMPNNSVNFKYLGNDVISYDFESLHLLNSLLEQIDSFLNGLKGVSSIEVRIEDSSIFNIWTNMFDSEDILRVKIHLVNCPTDLKFFRWICNGCTCDSIKDVIYKIEQILLHRDIKEDDSVSRTSRTKQVGKADCNDSYGVITTPDCSRADPVIEDDGYHVEEDGIYHIHTCGEKQSKQLIIPKDTFIEALHKYLGGTI